MAQGYSPKLPLVYDLDDGPFGLTKTVKQAVAQDLKGLLLTAPGERVMDTSFGVGIRNYLFEGITVSTLQRLSSGIRTQVSQYLPFIDIVDINILTHDQNPNIDPNTVVTQVIYSIAPIDEQDVLTISTQVD